jgi:hypothetical protein
LLFAGTSPGAITVCDLPDCSRITQLSVRSPGAGPLGFAQARWSPDGKGLIYINKADRDNLWVQPIDGSAASPLTRLGDARILDFGWSANRQHLVLLRDQSADDLVLVRGFR